MLTYPRTPESAGPAASGLDRRGSVSQLKTRDTVLLALALSVSTLCIVAAYFPPGEALATRFALFWAGMVLLTVACYVTVSVRRLSSLGMTTLIAVAGTVSYLPKLFRSLPRPAYLDELFHLRQSELLLHGVLLGGNTADPTVGYFPLFQVTTVAVHGVTTLSLWHSALVVAGLGHVLLLLAIYALALEFGFTARVAASASLFYMAGPSVLFWLSEASYESIALPLAVFAAVGCMRFARAPSVGRGLLAGGMVFLTVVAQPVSALFLAFVLLVLGTLDSISSDKVYRPVRYGLSVLVIAGVGTVVVDLAWFAAMGWSTVWHYILPSAGNLGAALTAILHLGHHRNFFRTSDLPSYEQYAGEFTLAIVPVVLGLAYLQYRHRGCRDVRTRLGLRAGFVMGALFVASYPFDLSTATFIWVHRSWQLVWVGVCVVLAVFADRIAPGGLHRAGSVFRGLLPATALLVVTLVGNTANNAPADYMFPVSYQFGAGVGLVTPQQLSAATWLRKHASGARIVSDTNTDVVQWAYGDVTPVHFPTWQLTFAGAALGARVEAQVRRYRVDYLVVDRLMYRERSAAGYVYSPKEPHAFSEGPVPASAYNRLLHTKWIHLVYSNRQVSIFALRPRAQSG